MQSRRDALGGYLPQRQKFAAPLEVPPLSVFEPLLKDSGDRELSTTMAFVRMLTILTRDKNIGKNIVPIVPDEARTFGMDGMFRQLGIYSSVGQLYTPEDRDQVMFYKEDKTGQILEEGITEAGSMSSWIAAATAYSTHGVNMIPFFVYYSMFGFQRIGDLAWAAGDMRARGFMIGGTAGRTTLNGEGLQHEDGHSHLLASTIPNCVCYDPCYAYEMAIIIHEGMRRMMKEQEDVYFYITAMNENYHQPALPDGATDGIIKGMYKLKSVAPAATNRVNLIGAGVILREVIAAADLLEKDWDIGSELFSVTSFTELRKEGLDANHWNLINPEGPQKVPYVTKTFANDPYPVIASSDYMKAVADGIREFIPTTYKVLGTDGFGRSDTREKLRDFFEVDRRYVVVAALTALAEDGKLDMSVVTQAINKYGIDPNKPNPVTV
jgi:pyruvate dehydrogenase E1 component